VSARNIVLASDNSSTGYLEAHHFTISGSNLTHVSTIDSYDEGGAQTVKMLRQGDAVYDPDSKGIILIHRDDGTSNYPQHRWVNPIPTDNGGYPADSSPAGVSQFVGFNTSAVADGGTATITTQGGLNENQSSLTAGTTYYVGLTGTIGTIVGYGSANSMAGLALSATKLLVQNFDPSGSV